jgi:hypothetical protein
VDLLKWVYCRTLKKARFLLILVVRAVFSVGRKKG